MMTTEEALELLHEDPGHEQAWENFYRQMYRPLLTYVRSLLLNFSLFAKLSHLRQTSR